MSHSKPYTVYSGDQEEALLRKVFGLIDSHRPYHTQLQIEAFMVTRSGVGDPYGMLQQSIRELNGRYWQIRSSNRGLDDLKDRAKALRKLDWLPFQRRHRARKLEALEDEIHVCSKKRDDLVREFGVLSDMAVKLEEQVGPDWNQDGIREKHERKFWAHKIKVRAAHELLSEGHFSSSTLDLIASLPVDLRKEIRTAIGKETRQGFLNWANTFGPDSLPVLETRTISPKSFG